MNNIQPFLSVDFFKEAFNSLKIGITILLKDGTFYFVNDELCSLLGYQRDEFIGKDFNFVVNKNETIEIDTILSQVNGNSEIDRRFIHKNGKLIWIHLKFNILKSDSNTNDYIIVSLEDVTEKKDTEFDLINSEEKNRALSDATHEAIFFSDKGICIECNTTASNLFGYSHKEFMGMNATQIIAPESKELVVHNLMTNYKEPYEALALKKDGTTFWAEIHGKMFTYKGREIRVSAFLDITERRKLIAQQKTSEYNYKLLFENMNEAFALHKIINNDAGKSIDFIYLDVNPVFEKLSGLKREQILNKKVSEILPNLEPFWVEKMAKVAERGESVHYTHFEPTLKKYFDTRAYCPNKGFFAVTFTDVTEKITSDNELAMHNKRLESLVRLSQVHVANYIDLIQKTLIEAIQLVNGNCGSFYFYNTYTDKYEYVNCVFSEKHLAINEGEIVNVFIQSLSTNSSKIWSKKELSTFLDNLSIPIKSLLCIPANSKGVVSLVFGIGSTDIEFSEFEKRHLELLIDSVLQIIEKQKYQDHILSEKIKAEINESRFFEIQKAGKIGWYEALIKEGLFMGSYETYNIFFDEYYDHPVSTEHLIQALHPDDREHFFSTVKNSIEMKLPEIEWESRVITPKKGVKHVFSKAFLKYDNEGNLIRRYGIVQDVTEKKKIELEITSHNERLESLFKIAQLTETSTVELLKKALHEAIQLTMSDIGFIFSFNKDKELLRLEAYSEENISKEKIYAFREIALRTKRNFLSTMLYFEKAYIDNNLVENEQIIHEVFGEDSGYRNIMLVPINKGDVESFWIIVINKSHFFSEIDGKQVALLMNSIWKLIERQNYQEELIKAKEKAEESDKLKSAFLANMSHEIRTPMNGIIGFSDLFVQEDISFDKRQSYAKIVIESGKQLLSIVDDILDISKIEVGQVIISKEPVSVNDIITSLFSFYSPRAKDLNINLFPYKDLTDGESIILTDKQRLIQILNNLISNALKFTLYGEISFGYIIKEDMLEFYVKDTGAGIPKEMHSIVFERFRQVEQSNIRNFRGTGLGLSISQKLIELLGGKIWLESEVGKGSTFYFSIPYVRANESGEILNIPQTKTIETHTTILIAEDEEINLFYVNEVLSKPGIKLLHAKDGIEAVDLCKKHAEINMVLMDIKMPNMDGFLATETIRKFRFDLPIIAVTAFAMEKDKEQAFLAGCNDYISKPLNKSVLLEMVGKYVKMPR